MLKRLSKIQPSNPVKSRWGSSYAFGALAVVATAVLWSLDGFIRANLFALPALQVVYLEHLLGTLLLAPFVVFRLNGLKQYGRKKLLILAILGLASGGLGTYLFTEALFLVGFVEFSVVILVQQAQPLFAVAAAMVILRERPSAVFGLLALLAIGFVYLLNFPDLRFDTGSANFRAALFGFGAAAVWGASTAVSKWVLNDTPVLHTTFMRLAAVAAVSYTHLTLPTTPYV